MTACLQSHDFANPPLGPERNNQRNRTWIGRAILSFQASNLLIIYAVAVGPALIIADLMNKSMWACEYVYMRTTHTQELRSFIVSWVCVMRPNFPSLYSGLSTAELAERYHEECVLGYIRRKVEGKERV